VRVEIDWTGVITGMGKGREKASGIAARRRIVSCILFLICGECRDSGSVGGVYIFFVGKRREGVCFLKYKE